MICSMWNGAVQGNTRRRCGAAAAAVATAALICAGAGGAGAAPAASSVEMPQPKECVPPIGTNQIVLPLPGVFLPLPSIQGVSEFANLPPAPPGARLPESVDLRDNSQGFNGYAEFALRDGSLYTCPRSSGAQWRAVPTPGCLDGAITAVSVDSNMLVALDDEGWIYSLDNLLSGPMLWNWTRSYGAPIWLWPGATVPEDSMAPGKWALSHRISDSFTDADGHVHPTTAGLVQIVALTGDGSRIVFQDPWLPADHSYEIGAPLGGRFQAASISGSGSVTVVMNEYGDMYTRKYDLDMAGANHIPGRYTWQEQGPLPPAPNQLAERFDPQYAAISLPAEEWQHQPKVPGTVTSRLSISQTGPRAEDRELRVEGMRGGQTGYWWKGLSGGTWSFTATGAPLAAPVLEDADPSADQSSLTLAPPTGMDYEGTLPDAWSMRVDDFAWAQTIHPVTLTSPSGREYPINMYTTDALRLLPRGDGLDATPRILEGALDVREADPWAQENAELGGFVRRHLDGKEIFEIGVEATTGHLAIAPVGLAPPPLAVLGRV